MSCPYWNTVYRNSRKTRCFDILKQPYLGNHFMNFYRTKTKLYVKASSIIICGKENEETNLKFWCNMPTTMIAISCHFQWFELVLLKTLSMQCPPCWLLADIVLSPQPGSHHLIWIEAPVFIRRRMLKARRRALPTDGTWLSSSNVIGGRNKLQNVQDAKPVPWWR